jgi:hypothetical protein
MRARPGPGIIQSAIRRRIFRIVFAPVALYIRGRDALDGPTPGARFALLGLTRGGILTYGLDWLLVFGMGYDMN